MSVESGNECAQSGGSALDLWLLGGLDTVRKEVPGREGSRSLGLGLRTTGADGITVCVSSKDSALGPGDPVAETPELNF